MIQIQKSCPTVYASSFFLLRQHSSNEALMLRTVALELHRMYAGGMYDHIGYGFSRYSTDEIFLVPHFEKMLYDNALLVLAYGKTYELTKNEFYRKVAEQTADYLLREMTDPEGGCYSAQDVDSTVRMVQGPTEGYPLLNERVSYYVCENRSCLPPMNQAEFLKHLGGER